MENPAKLLRTLLPPRQAVHGSEHHQPMGTTTENDTEAYIIGVLKLGSLGGKEKLLPPSNASGYGRLSRMIAAMTTIECGIPYGQVDMEAVYQGYLLAFPKNKKKLEEWLNEEDEYFDW